MAKEMEETVNQKKGNFIDRLPFVFGGLGCTDGKANRNVADVGGRLCPQVGWIVLGGETQDIGDLVDGSKFPVQLPDASWGAEKDR